MDVNRTRRMSVRTSGGGGDGAPDVYKVYTQQYTVKWITRIDICQFLPLAKWFFRVPIIWLYYFRIYIYNIISRG